MSRCSSCGRPGTGVGVCSSCSAANAWIHVGDGLAGWKQPAVKTWIGDEGSCGCTTGMRRAVWLLVALASGVAGVAQGQMLQGAGEWPLPLLLLPPSAAAAAAAAVPCHC